MKKKTSFNDFITLMLHPCMLAKKSIETNFNFVWILYVMVPKNSIKINLSRSYLDLHIIFKSHFQSKSNLRIILETNV